MALKRLNSAQAQFPKHLGLQLLRFNLLNEMGRTLPALKVLRQLRRQEFDKPQVLIAAARFYRTHGRLRAARAVLERLLAIKPEHRQARLMQLDLARESATRNTASPLPALLTRAHKLPALTVDDAAELLHAIKLTNDPALNESSREALRLETVFSKVGKRLTVTYGDQVLVENSLIVTSVDPSSPFRIGVAGDAQAQEILEALN